jgi:hypothetical protein
MRLSTLTFKYWHFGLCDWLTEKTEQRSFLIGLNREKPRSGGAHRPSVFWVSANHKAPLLGFLQSAYQVPFSFGSPSLDCSPLIATVVPVLLVLG